MTSLIDLATRRHRRRARRASRRPAVIAPQSEAAAAPAVGGQLRHRSPSTASPAAAVHGRADGCRRFGARRPLRAPAASDTQFLKYDAASNTVTFRLVAGPFDFNGYTGGGGTLTVPPGSNNVINFEQNDGTPHSAEIGPGTGPVPNSGGDVAIPRAYTNKVVEGLPQGATDVMRFTAPDSGTYRIICGVPGHALSGMWIWYKIDPAAKAPASDRRRSSLTVTRRLSTWRFERLLASARWRNRPGVAAFARAATSSGVPAATTSPPRSPPSGPRSMIQSAVLMTSRLCSITTTLLPLSTSRCSTSSSRRTSSKCRPVVGSSRM